jgi:hypothetical protein
MVLARVAEYLFPSDTIPHHEPTAAQRYIETTARKVQEQEQELAMAEGELDAARPPYIHVSCAKQAIGRHPLTPFRQCLQEESAD